MSGTSTAYTIGTALGRAQDSHVPVDLLVGGQWIHGHVLALDGHGAVLGDGASEHHVVRVEHVSAVRLTTAAPSDATPVGLPGP